jgi:hypothetical protein
MDEIARADGERRRREREARHAAMTEAELIAGIQLDDRWAIDEFVRRYHRLLLNRAWRAGIAAQWSEDTVVQVLQRVLERIALGRLSVRTSLAAYLVAAFWHEYRKVERVRRERERLLRRNLADPAGTREGYTVGVVSQYSVRASHGPEWEPLPIPLAVERLASMLEDELSEDEQRFLIWVANDLSIRELAKEFDTDYETLRKRIWRLRERMRETALRFADHFRLEERMELERFFERAQRLYEAAMMEASVARERRLRAGAPGAAEDPRNADIESKEKES